MKSFLEQKEEFSTTSDDKKLRIKENNHLFNHIDKLAADHDVTVTSTMIKITYKKALKDQNPSEDSVGHPDSDLAWEKNHPTERVKAATTTLTNSDISLISKSPKVQIEGNKEPMFHSTPKQSTIILEKKKKYMNGLNLIAKPNNRDKKSSVSKVQKLQEEGASSPKKSKTIANQKAKKHDFGKKFLKGNGLVKSKASIIQKSHADPKKTKLNKESDKKVKKLENGTQSKTWIEKTGEKIGGLKRKASNSELNVFTKYKKLKISENKRMKVNDESEGLEDNDKSGIKRQIMLVDPNLPEGWTRSVRTKNKDSANEQYVVYIVNPQGEKFRYKWKLRKYLLKTNSTLDADQFFFGLYERPKSSNSLSPDFKKYEKSADAIPDTSKGHESETSTETEKEEVKPYDLSNNDAKISDGKELLLFDPDLPFGWKRIIHSNSVNGRKQVHIISPDGKIFRRRYRLNEYLIKHQFPHNLERFYFGLYPKKEGNPAGNLGKKSEEKTQNFANLVKSEISSNTTDSAIIYSKTKTASKNLDKKIDINKIKVESKLKHLQPAMYDDPNLPEGWKRFIKIRSYGESAGRMEVVIVSPDGRRHRSKKHLEHYLLQKQLKYKVGDFDFTVFGKSNVKKRPSKPHTPEPDPKLELSNETKRETEPESESEPFDLGFLSMKKKFTDKPVPELDISSLKDTVITPEGHMINTVNGLMICSDLSSARNERRQRLPRAEHEKKLKNLLSSEGDLSCNGCEIPTFWIQRLVKCRADLRNLESDAASTLAEFTKGFIKILSLWALTNSKEPEAGLKYEDMAELVDRMESLSFLKTLIPKKITFREYIKLNRPKQFMSFT